MVSISITPECSSNRSHLGFKPPLTTTSVPGVSTDPCWLAMTKIDKVVGQEPGSSNAAKKESHALDKAVKKAINDNLRGMSAQELHGTLDDSGMTCYQRIAERKRKNKESPDEFPLGAKFYKDW